MFGHDTSHCPASKVLSEYCSTNNTIEPLCINWTLIDFHKKRIILFLFFFLVKYQHFICPYLIATSTKWIRYRFLLLCYICIRIAIFFCFCFNVHLKFTNFCKIDDYMAFINTSLFFIAVRSTATVRCAVSKLILISLVTLLMLFKQFS